MPLQGLKVSALIFYFHQPADHADIGGAVGVDSDGAVVIVKQPADT